MVDSMVIEIMPEALDPVGDIVPISDHSACDSLSPLGRVPGAVGASEKPHRLPAARPGRYVRLYGIRREDSSAVAVQADEKEQSVVMSESSSGWLFRYLMLLGAFIIVVFIIRELLRRR